MDFDDDQDEEEHDDFLSAKGDVEEEEEMEEEEEEEEEEGEEEEEEDEYDEFDDEEDDFEIKRKAQEDMLLGKAAVGTGESKKKKRKLDEKKSALSEEEKAILEAIKDPKRSKTDQQNQKDSAEISQNEREHGIELDENTVLDPIFSRVIKPHQAVGIRFLWSHASKDDGCILADYMGLGKTLQNISLIHTFLKWHKEVVNPSQKNTVLIVAPASVITNWKREMHKWMDEKTKEGAEALRLFNVNVLDSKTGSSMENRSRLVFQWLEEGGCLIMGYEMFRMLSQPALEQQENSKKKTRYDQEAIATAKALTQEPGPSLIVVDEGHRLRQVKSQIVKAISQVRTRARIVLTGYPLQNHLDEYWCMVNFARPGWLGTMEQFKHRFKVPIENGQAADSDERDAELARMRTFVLNDKLKPIILRRDSQHLAKDLPPKYEWVVRCRLTELQAQLYRAFVRDKCREAEKKGGDRGGIIAAYHYSMSVVNHPEILYNNLAKVWAAKGSSSSFSILKQPLWMDMVHAYEHLRTVDPQMCVKADTWHLQDLTVAPGFEDSLLLREGRVATVFEQRDSIEHQRPILFVTHVEPAEDLAYYVRKLDEIVAVNGQPVDGSEERFQQLLSQSHASGSPQVLLKIRRFHRQSWMACELERVLHQAPSSQQNTSISSSSSSTSSSSPNDETVPSQEEAADADVPDVDREVDNEDDGGDIVELGKGFSSDQHALVWAEPLMQDFKPGTRLSDSGKMIVLFALLRYSRQRGDKVIVFSQSVQTLNIVEEIIRRHNRHVDAEFDRNEDDEDEVVVEGSDAVPYLDGVRCGIARIDGATPQVDRHRIVEEFNASDIAEKAVFLASTRAAGEGINIQSANRVVMFDACWNPCLDHEAMCRAYRFGQTKPVFVYRLVAAGTMEKTIFDQQTKKEGLTSRVVDARATKRTVEAADLRNFFNLKQFNRLQKEKVSLHDLNDVEVDEGDSSLSSVAGSPTSEDESSTKQTKEAKAQELEKTMTQRKALKDDEVLQNLLRIDSDYVTQYKLEDLLMNEDEKERATPEAREKARQEFEAYEAEERRLISEGLAPSTAAAVAWRNIAEANQRRKTMQRLVAEGSREQEQVQNQPRLVQAQPQQPMVTMQPNGTPVIRLPENFHSLAPELQRKWLEYAEDLRKKIEHAGGSAIQQQATQSLEADAGLFFRGKRFLLLRRRMPDSEKLMQAIRSRGGSAYLEIGNDNFIDYVISTWNTMQLESWKERQRNIFNERNKRFPDFKFKFKTVKWVFDCIKAGKLLESEGDPNLPDVVQVEETIEPKASSSSSSSSSSVSSKVGEDKSMAVVILDEDE